MRLPQRRFGTRSKFQKILYCAWLWMALLGCVAGLTGIVVAQQQEDRPEITPNERKAPRKKDAGPRAVAVLQMAGQWQGIAGAYRHSGERQILGRDRVQGGPHSDGARIGHGV